MFAVVRACTQVYLASLPEFQALRRIQPLPQVAQPVLWLLRTAFTLHNPSTSAALQPLLSDSLPAAQQLLQQELPLALRVEAGRQQEMKRAQRDNAAGQQVASVPTPDMSVGRAALRGLRGLPGDELDAVLSSSSISNEQAAAVRALVGDRSIISLHPEDERRPALTQAWRVLSGRISAACQGAKLAVLCSSGRRMLQRWAGNEGAAREAEQEGRDSPEKMARCVRVGVRWVG